MNIGGILLRTDTGVKPEAIDFFNRNDAGAARCLAVLIGLLGLQYGRYKLLQTRPSALRPKHWREKMLKRIAVATLALAGILAFAAP